MATLRSIIGHFIGSLFLKQRLFVLLLTLIVLFILAFFWATLFEIGIIGLVVLSLLVMTDYFLLYQRQHGIFARRVTPDRFSNGDENPISIFLENKYHFIADLEIIDESPEQFQMRDHRYGLTLQSGGEKTLSYILRPISRGEYHFGAVNVFVSSPLGLLSRRYKFSQDAMVATYPSFIHLRKYELLAISNNLQDAGIKKIRRLGHAMEFEQIKEYVPGDDIRTVNWKATAKRASLMVNQYQEEKAQNVYNVIDMGRTMKMPFLGMSLLDYAINSSLVLSKIAITKGDKAGVMAFSHNEQKLVTADRRSTQMYTILENLYRLDTAFKEPNFEMLYAKLKRQVTQRSLMVFYTNFESLYGLERQLPYLKALAKSHLLLVVFFENTVLSSRVSKPASDTKEIYDKVIAEKFMHEKRQIVKELKKYGIQSILTPPEHLTVNTINRYLEIKARGSL